MLEQSTLIESRHTKINQNKARSKLTDAIPDWPDDCQKKAITDTVQTYNIGVLEGEGVGPEVIAATMDVLDVVEKSSPFNFAIQYGGLIGKKAIKKYDKALTSDVAQWCETVFQNNGAILCGPGGERFVYDIRAHFDLFCKYTPIHPQAALSDTGALRSEKLHNVDMVVVRENISGLYFGEFNQKTEQPGKEKITHTYGYNSDEVKRIIEVSIRLAKQRKRHLSLVVKPGGIPAISHLWCKIFYNLTEGEELQTSILEIDNACYQIIDSAAQFDVVLAPNMFGDVLSDCAALLLGSRGLSYSGNFGAQGISTYQTGHGAAHDIANKNIANPIGQILSAAMMLRETFGLFKESAAISTAIAQVLSNNIRTADIAGPNAQIVGTRKMGETIANAVKQQL